MRPVTGRVTADSFLQRGSRYRLNQAFVLMVGFERHVA